MVYSNTGPTFECISVFIVMLLPVGIYLINAYTLVKQINFLKVD